MAHRGGPRVQEAVLFQSLLGIDLLSHILKAQIRRDKITGFQSLLGIGLLSHDYVVNRVRGGDIILCFNPS
ncbi:hypothetical protein HKBW3S47_02194 [Candidatus Hakubella thermalkaliphila]|uniref:Uncharacterized protein n=1 Tax=Candidatus Hakubella thermalkaliphila TaxID=2754717 RepID=A0A6V8Q7C0_9ACTN|nr:hypothetical protein HKBW3S47_02194 [Candidatus Hakubella thermalkaliphila]